MDGLAPHELQTLREALARLPAAGRLALDAPAIARLSGQTNRTYRLHGNGATPDLVVRLPGGGTERLVDRSREVRNLETAARGRFAPAIIDANARHGIILMPFVHGARPLALMDAGDLHAAGARLRALHESGLRFEGALDPLAVAAHYLDVAPEDRLARWLDRLRTVAMTPRDQRPCHGDPGPANWLLREDAAALLIDWEYAAMADPAWDLAVLAIEASLDRAAEAALVQAYDAAHAQHWQRRLDAMRPRVHLVSGCWAHAMMTLAGPSPALGARLSAALHALDLGTHT